MNQFLLRNVRIAATLAVLGAPLLASAESDLQTGGGALTATARLDFRITVPRVLFLQVGTGASMTNNATINEIVFDVLAPNVGDGNPISATFASGDLNNGTVTARLIGNDGAVTLSATTLGALSNGAGDTISYGQIDTTSTDLASAPPLLTAPALADGATTSLVVPAAGKIVNRDAQWTFSYLNTNVVPPGTYGGVNVNNSRVTYTASMP